MTPFTRETAIWKKYQLNATRLHLIRTLETFRRRKFMMPGCIWQTDDRQAVVIATIPNYSRKQKEYAQLKDKTMVIPVKLKPTPIKIRRNEKLHPKLEFRSASVPALVNNKLAFLNLAECAILPLTELHSFIGKLLENELKRIEPIFRKIAASKIPRAWLNEL